MCAARRRSRAAVISASTCAYFAHHASASASAAPMAGESPPDGFAAVGAGRRGAMKKGDVAGWAASRAVADCLAMDGLRAAALAVDNLRATALVVRDNLRADALDMD